jgi:exosortase
MSEHAQAESVNGSAGASSLSGFMDEAVDIWRRLPHKLLFTVLFAAWIALFHYYGNATFGYIRSASLFDWAKGVYLWREDDQFGMYMPFAVIFFLWYKRNELSEISAKVWWPAVGYFAFALLLHFAAFRVQQTRISILAFILGLHALIGLLWGREAMRRTVFPIFLLLFSIPFGSLADPITFNLRVFVTKISVGIGHNVLGIEVFRDGSQIFGPTGRALYDVAPACSGMRSLVAMSALSVIYAFLTFKSWWRRLVLILCALPLAIVSNIVRVTTVIIVGDAFGQQAGAMIEQKFGFVTFLTAIIGMMGIGWLLRERKATPAQAPSRETLETETTAA